MEFIFDRNNQATANSKLGVTDFSIHSPLKRTQRKPVQAVDEIEITGNRPTRRRRAAAKAPVKYVSGVKKKSRSKASKQPWSMTKLGWVVCACLFLRLVFMDNGILDFYQMEDTIKEKNQTLLLTKKENKELVRKIHKIKTSPRYQRKVAREHLGVIAPNEYLVIFAKDS